MKGNITADGTVSRCEAWVAVDKNRYEQGVTINAILHTNVLFAEKKINAILTDPRGNTEAILPVKNNSVSYYLPVKADMEGVYTLACIIEDTYSAGNECQSGGKNIKRMYICSSSFFIGNCEAAIPKVPTASLLFVPEIWEDPDFYKLISFYLNKDGNPVPFAPVMLTLLNRSGCLKKALSTDGSGNVYFTPYMEGTYCLISKATFDEVGDTGTVEVTTTFSFTLSESEEKRLRARKQS